MTTITNAQLAAVIANILTNPFSGHLDSAETFGEFCTGLAQIVCNYCGGDVLEPAKYNPQEGSVQWGNHYQLTVCENESSPGHDVWQAPPVVAVPTALFSALLSMATKHVDDIQNGIQSGIYAKEDNTDIGEKLQALELSKPIVSNYHSTAYPAPARDDAQTLSSVQVKHWDTYGNAKVPTSHQCDVDDRRKAGGQIYIDIGPLGGATHDLMGAIVEVNTNPLNGEDHVPCIHIHFDTDALAVSLFKIGDRILVRPENEVEIERFTQEVYGVNETLYWID